MMKVFIAALTVAAATSVAIAQDTQPAPQEQLAPQDLPENGGAGVRTGHITTSGETVPNPGASQSAGTTDLDRGIQREDTKIENSICKGC